jgi:hypothetical protein
MFILPYIYTQSTSASGLLINKLQLFLGRGGHHLLYANDPVHFCEYNDMELVSSFTEVDIHYMKVRVRMNEFYTFNEKATQDLEVWRTFVFVGDIAKDPWNVNENFPPISGRPLLRLVAPVLRMSA